MDERYELSVVGPAYNEEKNIKEFVNRTQNTFRQNNINGEIIFINDKSTDNTGNIIDEIVVKNENVIVIHNKENLGIAKNWSIGVENSKGQYICLIDTDLQNRPEDIAILYKKIIDSKVDLVQGYRKRVDKEIYDIQFFLSRGLNFLLNFIFSMKAQDNKSGFVVCKKITMIDILDHKKSYSFWQTFITVATKNKNYSIAEVGTIFDPRKEGQSYLSHKLIKSSLLSIVDIAKSLSEYKFSKNR